MAKLIQRTEKEFAWQNLADAVQDGSSGLKVGDEIADVVLKDGQKVTMQVAWVAEDGAAVKLISKNCLKEEYRMNEERTNKGGFPASDLFKKLQTEIFELLPDDLAAVVADETRQQMIDGEVVEYTCKLWLPTEKEIHGENYFGEDEDDNTRQLPIFEDRRNRIKKLGENGEYTCWYWCDSPYASNTTIFCLVDYGGLAHGYGASTALGVPVCFTIK